MAEVSYQQQVVREAPEIEAYKLGLLEEARNLYGAPLDLPAYEVAGQAPGQIQAADLLRQGIGAYEPYMQAGSQALTQGQTLAQQGAQLAGGINVQPQFQAAQSALGRGLGAADVLGGYAQTAGQGLQDVMGGIAGIEQARRGLPSYMQGDLGTSQALLGEATRGTRAAGPSDFSQQAGLLLGSQGTAASAAQRAEMAAQTPGLQTLSFTQPGMAGAYMSPYMQSVVDIQQREAQRQADIARTQRAGQAVSAGAFGGSRQAVLEAEAARNLAQQKSDIQAMGMQQAYQQAQQQFNTEQQARLGAASTQAGLGMQAAAQRFQQAGFDANTAMQLAQLQQTRQQQGMQQAAQLQGIAGLYGQQGMQQAQLGQAGTQLAGQLAGQQAQLGMMPAQIAQTQAGILGQQAGLYGQLGQGIAGLSSQQAGIDLQRAAQLQQAGQGIGALGMQQASLGQAVQQAGQADVSALMGVGAMEQANAQAQLDAMRATQMQDVMAPYQQLGFVADIYKGAPSSQSALIASSQPSASPFQTAAGLGIAGLSAAAGAKKVGLF
jgi:hypothetical protein